MAETTQLSKYAPKTAAKRTERARKAGLAAQTPEAHAQKLVRDWPELTAEQKHTVRALLRPVIKGAATK